MSSDQVAKLAATIEVLTGAVHFLVAERIAAQPVAAQGDLLRILQRAFSTPPRRDDAFTGARCWRIPTSPGGYRSWPRG